VGILEEMTESRRSFDAEVLEKKALALEQELAPLKRGGVRRGVRKRSEMTIGDMPLWEIVLGPDPENNEVRGHARGFIAIGDTASGVIAVGPLPAASSHWGAWR
jgi:hypothetical protein